MAEPKYRIMLTFWDENWKEKTIQKYDGQMLEQMKNLFYRAKERNRVGDRAIRLTLVDADDTIIEKQEY